MLRPEVPNVPDRAMTAGDRLLSRLPLGAQLLVEVDLARLRANPVVGSVVGDALRAGSSGAVSSAVLAGPLAQADTVVLAAYRVGTAAATTVTVVAGGQRPADALDLGDGVWGLAPEGEIAGLLMAADGGPSTADDLPLLAVRAWAMPAAGDSASVRITARLDSTGQHALAGALNLAAAPATVSLWGDVADDLAVVVHLADEAEASRGRPPAWLRGVSRLIQQAARADEFRTIGLSKPIALADLRREPGGARWELVVDPGQLRRAVRRFRSQPRPSGVDATAQGVNPP
jgi:hypothetical protein